MHRNGNICDTLVFCLAAILIPAWVAGHIFLTFFPAPTVAKGKATASSLSQATETSGRSLEPANSSRSLSPGSALTESAAATTTTPASNQLAEKLERELEALKQSYATAKKENDNLSAQATELSQQSSNRATEIDLLKNQLAKLSNADQSLASTNKKLQSLTQQHTQLRERHLELQTVKATLESKVQQLESSKDQLTMPAETVADDGVAEIEIAKLRDELEESKNSLQRQRELVQKLQNAQSADSRATEATVVAKENAIREAAKKQALLQTQVTELTASLGATKKKLVKRAEELANAKKAAGNIESKYKLALRRLAAAKIGAETKTANKKAAQKSQSVTNIAQPTSQVELAGPSSAPIATEESYREYVSSRGNRSKLAFIEWVGDDQVIVRSSVNRKLYQLPLSRFSAPDQKYLMTLKPNN